MIWAELGLKKNKQFGGMRDMGEKITKKCIQTNTSEDPLYHTKSAIMRWYVIREISEKQYQMNNENLQTIL